MPKISALPPAGTLADDDETPFVDDSVSTTKKFTLAGLLVWLQSKLSWVTAAMLDNGVSVQTVSTMSSAVATGTTLIPLDDSIPQITEGNEYMTLAITPKSATNVLVISVKTSLANSAAACNLIGALFQDATADALAATTVVSTGASNSSEIIFTHSMVAGNTTARTYRVRLGAQVAGTTTFNGRAGGRLFGAIPKSSIVITEYKA